MIIKKSVYYSIVNTVPHVPPEVGVLLGGDRGIISHYHIDYGYVTEESGCYYPNVQILNDILTMWNGKSIDLIGFAHTHCPNSCFLSNGDKIYITNIMTALQDSLDSLLFPIIIPKEKIISYTANYNEQNILIASDKIILVE